MFIAQTAEEFMVVIGLFNPKSPTNVGAVMRAAGCYGAAEVRYTGERFERAAKFNTDTKNAQSSIALTACQKLENKLPHGCKVVCVELAVGAVTLPEFQHPEKAIYLFGPEDSSLPQSTLDHADHVVYVPTKGCMNLAATVNVVLYDRLSKNLSRAQGDDLIKQSRDANNRLQAK